MTHEYGHPIVNEAIRRAVRLALSLRSERLSASIDELATEAVDATFCNASRAQQMPVARRAPPLTRV
jgi:hypothetical protein